MNPKYKSYPELCQPTDIIDVIQELLTTRDLQRAADSLLEVLRGNIVSPMDENYEYEFMDKNSWAQFHDMFRQKDVEKTFWFLEHAKRYFAMFMPLAGYGMRT